MKVMKFGGTSVGNADRIREVGRLVAEAAAARRVGLVVSAVTGVTNHLVASVAGVLGGAVVDDYVRGFADVHAAVRRDLAGHVSEPLLRQADQEIATVTAEYANLLTGVRLLGECSDSVMDHLSSLGERASTPLVAAVLAARGLAVLRVDPREFVITDSVFGNASPLMGEIEKRFARVLDDAARVILMPGFFGATASGKTTTLGRGGSDYSAAIMAAAVKADVLEIWTDVDGVFTADPRVVPEAFVQEEMSYAEAMELSFFGAKVLHPRTIAPVVGRGIPTWIKNTFNPTHPGTCIRAEAGPSRWPVRGLSTLGGVAMIGMSGAGLRGVPGVAARVFSAMAREEISVILIAQSSSEYSICFCVSATQAGKAVVALNAEFALEQAAGLVNPTEVAPELSILSVVGEQMRSRRGIAGTLFGALAKADVNVVAIAQGFSERNISAVVAKADTERAMRAAHQYFFNTRQVIQVFVVGLGAVGGQLVEQMRQQQARLAEDDVDLRVCGLADSRRLRLDCQGLDLREWRRLVTESSRPFDLDAMLREVREARLMNPVFVDCTGSAQIAESYLPVFEAGMHVVTSNKKANSGTAEYYKVLRQTAGRRRRQFLYETNVGAGLPIIDTLKNLIKSGDRLHSCRGVLSGSLSFIFGRLDEAGMTFSQALAEARTRGFTEPDPRDDLSGLDVARKLLILAREAGMQYELADVRISSPLPVGFAGDVSVESFMERCRELDAGFAERVRQLQQAGRALRFVGTIDGTGLSVGLTEVDASDPLYHIRDGENAVSLLTDRYRPIPLVVRGYGAGPAVTAAGVFADLLRTVFWHTESQ